MNQKSVANSNNHSSFTGLYRLLMPAFLVLAVIASLLLMTLSEDSMFSSRYAFGYGYGYGYDSGDTGGGEPAPETGTTFVYDVVTPEGRFTQNVIAQSANDKVTLNIPGNTIGKTSTGTALNRITINPMASPPPPPAQSNIIDISYELGPSGATFSPPITITYNYDPALLPAGVDENTLTLAFFDTATNSWVVLEGITVDTVNNTISAKVSHFTVFAVISPPQPAPTTAPTPKPTTTVPTTLAPTPQPTTSAPTTMAPTPQPTTAAPTTSAPTAAPTAAPTTTPEPRGGANWWLWGGIIIVVVIIAAGAVIIIRRRK